MCRSPTVDAAARARPLARTRACSFIKLRMDRVLKAEFTASGEVADVLRSNDTNPTLTAANRTPEATPPPGPERTAKGYKDEWSAVYDKYDSNWWNKFLPPQ